MPIEKLTEKVKKLATETNDDKEDWEEEWEAAIDKVDTKVELKKPVIAKEPTSLINGNMQKSEMKIRVY